MIHYLILTIITSLFIQGWNYAINCETFPGGGEPVESTKEILWFIKYYGMKWIPKFFHKPLFTCPICMSSFYGSAAFWVDLSRQWHPVNSYTILTWVVFIVSLAGLNRIITKFIHS